MHPGKDTGFLIKRIHNAIRARGDQRLKENDLTVAQIRVLHFLEKSGQAVSQKELEAFFQVSHPTMTGILSRLKAKGFLQTQVDEKDRRCRVALITQAGTKAHAAMEAGMSAMEETMLSGFGPEDRAQFRAFLERAYENITKE